MVEPTVNDFTDVKKTPVRLVSENFRLLDTIFLTHEKLENN